MLNGARCPRIDAIHVRIVSHIFVRSGLNGESEDVTINHGMIER